MISSSRIYLRLRVRIGGQKEKDMKKTFELVGLDCANCAAKMERAVAGIDGVHHVSVSFITQRMVLDADDERFDDILKQAVKKCRRVEPDCKVRI